MRHIYCLAKSLILPAKSELATIPLKREPLLAVLPEGHPLTGSLRHGIKPNVLITVENDYTAMALVSKGFEFSIFPELSLEGPAFPLIRKGREIPAYRDLAIAIRSYDTASAATKNFLNCVGKWVKDFYEKK